jgi:hypothetical protein
MAALLKRLIKIKKCLAGEAIISEAAPLVKANPAMMEQSQAIGIALSRACKRRGRRAADG